MILRNKSGLQLFTFASLADFTEIRHGICTRNNGFSHGDFQSLNTAFSVGDDEPSVGKNRNAIARCMGTQQLEFVNQIHKTGILILSRKKGKYFLSTNGSSGAAANASGESADAVISDISGKVLAIQLADCQGISLYDPQAKVVANIHSGWRGSVGNIISTCVGAMQSEFGCRPAHMIAGISPSLGPCCAEFVHYRTEIPEIYWQFKDASDHFDFWKITQNQLINSGLLPQHIEIANICTKCNSHLFFSFRKKKNTGRFVSVIGLK